VSGQTDQNVGLARSVRVTSDLAGMLPTRNTCG